MQMTASATKATKKKPVKAAAKKAVKKPAPGKSVKVVAKPVKAATAKAARPQTKAGKETVKPAAKNAKKVPVKKTPPVKVKPVDSRQPASKPAAVKKPAAKPEMKKDAGKAATAKKLAVKKSEVKAAETSVPRAKTVPMYEPVPTSSQTKAKRELSRTLKPSERFNKSDLKKFEEQLLRMREDISSQTGTMKETALRGMDDVNPEEDGTDAHMRTLTLQQVNVKTTMLAKIDEALRAISKGTYGICDSCGNLIRKQRLQAQPFSKTCIHCQSEMERGRLK